VRQLIKISAGTPSALSTHDLSEVEMTCNAYSSSTGENPRSGRNCEFAKIMSDGGQVIAEIAAR